jgi:DNA polymerase III sliding clamp (beta) subunit (PCNA family)
MLKWLLLSVSKNSSISEHLGVTMIYSKVMHLWTTDAKTISWAKVELPEAAKLPRITVPSAFFEEMLSLADDGDVFSVTDKSAMTSNQSGVRLFSRLLEVDRPLNFAGVVKKSNPGNAAMIPIPDGLDSALDRAGLIREGKNAEPVQINIREGHFDLYLRTPLGEVKDRMDLEGEHNEVSAKFDPSLISRSLEDRASFLVTANALIMNGPDAFTCFISTLQS